jgi:7-cyano-7-deazaguanine synthase
MPDKATLLWTGGWDSTFRLLQLLLIEKRSVQPIYVIDSTRYSTLRELESMDVISKMVVQRLRPGVTLYPNKVFLRSDFPDNYELKDRFNFLKKQTRIGSQYYWLALIAENEKWNSVELSMERYQSPSGLQKVIFNGIEGERPTLNDSWEAELFKYWSFPLLTTTKSQMKQIAKDHGFFDILLKRWFCFRPIRGKCCGTCRPCELAIAERATDGLEFIHPAEVAARKFVRRIKSKLNSLSNQSSKVAKSLTGNSR